jgi:Nuclear cap-binding protein subunit 3/RNA binding domain
MSKERNALKNSVSECTWTNSFWRAAPDADWIQKTLAAADDASSHENENDVAGVHLSEPFRLKLVPQSSKHKNPSFRWNESHFHPQLKADDSEGLVLLFQAMARESIMIGLSSQPNFKGMAWEVLLGGTGNTMTLIRRLEKGYFKRKKGHHKMVSVSIPSRVCRDDRWVSYWICLCHDKVYVGTGNTPGKECFAVLDTTENAVGDAVVKQEGRHVNGDGNDTAKEQESDANKSTTNDQAMEDTQPLPPIQYVGIGNAAKPGGQQGRLMLQNVLLTNLPSFLVQELLQVPSQDDLPIVVLPPDTPESQELLQLMQDYKKECQTRKARAAKYGTEYKQLPSQEFLPWTKAKRLRENPEKGFVSGIDLMDPEELAKQEARKARFGDVSDDAANITAAADDDEQESSKEAANPSSDLRVEQAWDKEKLLRPLRTDPPPYLWKTGSSDDALAPESDPFAMEKPQKATWVPEKLHLSSIDWAAFKQIRNKDIMSFFNVYGPSYIEWLGDVSCNVCFEDRHSASRALRNLSNEIPSPVPDSVQSVGDEDVLDLGEMTWRLGKQAIRKVSNDRYGRKGTTARILVRMATTEDILVDRPNTWPAPPGGFSTTKVLGPDSDYPAKKHKTKGNRPQNDKIGRTTGNKKRQRKTAGKSQDEETAESLLGRGLSSGRAGFSVEDMERERAEKKQKVDG